MTEPQISTAPKLYLDRTKIHTIRIATGVRLYDVAHVAGIAEYTLARLMRGLHPVEQGLAQRLADALGANVDAITRDTPAATPALPLGGAR